MVLVVDDEPDITELIRECLGEHQITVANSAGEALQLLESTTFDLVICDLLMPDVSGMELYQATCRVAPEHANRFLFLSGAISNPDIKAFLDTVSNPYLQKPFRLRQLKALVDGWPQAASSRRPGG